MVLKTFTHRITTGEKMKAFTQFAIKVILVHCVTYIGMGMIMSNLLDYRELFQQEVIRDFMLPLDAHTPFAILFQPVRGLLFAIALWPLRELLLQKKHGWLILWSIFLVFGIFSTTAAAPSSIEGILYSKIPAWYHLVGLPEIMLQTLFFSLLLIWWEKRQSVHSESQHNTSAGFFSNLFMAVVVSSFAYIGYAVGSLTIFFLTPTDIDFGSAAGDIKTQLMFVVAFIFNVIYVFYISKQWLGNKISLAMIFVFAWILDSIVIFLYQLIFFGSSSLMTTILIGFLPAVIIALSIRQNYKKV